MSIKLASKKQVCTPLQVGHGAQQRLPECSVKDLNAVALVDGVKNMKLAGRIEILVQCRQGAGHSRAVQVVAGQGIQGAPDECFGMGKGGAHDPIIASVCESGKSEFFNCLLSIWRN